MILVIIFSVLFTVSVGLLIKVGTDNARKAREEAELEYEDDKDQLESEV